MYPSCGAGQAAIVEQSPSSSGIGPVRPVLTVGHRKCDPVQYRSLAVVRRVEHDHVAGAAERGRRAGLGRADEPAPREPVRRRDDDEVAALDFRSHAPALDGDERRPRSSDRGDDDRDQQDRGGGREQAGEVPRHVRYRGWKRLEVVAGG